MLAFDLYLADSNSLLAEFDITRDAVLPDFGPAIEADAGREERNPVLDRILGFLEAITRDAAEFLDAVDFVDGVAVPAEFAAEENDAPTIRLIGNPVPERGERGRLNFFGTFRFAANDDFGVCGVGGGEIATDNRNGFDVVNDEFHD